jgi:hypothetical protein
MKRKSTYSHYEQFCVNSVLESIIDKYTHNGVWFYYCLLEWCICHGHVIIIFCSETLHFKNIS